MLKLFADGNLLLPVAQDTKMNLLKENPIAILLHLRKRQLREKRRVRFILSARVKLLKSVVQEIKMSF